MVVVPTVLVNSPETVPAALLLNVAALLTVPVMVRKFSTSPVAETVTAPTIRLLLVSVPPLTLAPLLSCPALVVVPPVLVSSPEIVLPVLLLKVAELLTVPVTAPLLLKVAALVTFDVMDPVEANVSVPPLIVVAPR